MRIHLCVALVAGLFLTSALLASAQSATPRTIVILGDSLTAGAGLNPAEAYPALLQARLAARGGQDQVINAGQSGDTSAGGLRRIDWLLQRPIDILVIALGGNDGLRGIDPLETRRNLQGIIDRARARDPSIQIVLAGMQMPPNLGDEYRARFAAVYPALARANDLVLIPFLLEGVGGRAELNQDDLIHPTAAGQRRIADTVWETLQPLLDAVPGD